MADFTHGSVPVSTAATQILAPVNPPREYAVIYNNGTGPTLLGGSNVVSNDAAAIVLTASGSHVLSERAVANAGLWAVATAARTIAILSKV